MSDRRWRSTDVRKHASGDDPTERVARRSRFAAAGLAFILLGTAAFAIWASQATATAAHRAATASRISDSFAAAATAVAAEESLERKYRLEPGSAVAPRYHEAAADLEKALARIRVAGDAVTRAGVARLLVRHASYLAAVGRMFTAVDRGETTTVLTIDRTEVDPAFAAIETAVLDGARDHHDVALAELKSLEDLQALTRRLTPAVFLLGLLLTALLAQVLHGYRRLLLAEKAKAVNRALHDELTGLPNRVLLAERLAAQLESSLRRGTDTGLLLLDLDLFKEINDTFGHHYGDRLLVDLGPRLTSVLREGDSVYRLGGDEFAVLLPDVGNLDTTIALAQRLRGTLDRSFHVDDVALDVEASVGVVVSPEHGGDPTQLLQRADVAMYVAKSQRLGVCAYDADADLNSPARLALLGELRRALRHHQLVLYYHPKVSISTGEVVGAEALLRWQHPVRGVVCPDEFMPAAEHTGLIGPLTRFVLDAALTQARAWIDGGFPLAVSVNLSARNLLDERLADQIVELLALHDVPAALLELEVTESAIIVEPERGQRLLERLAEIGVSISLDDFGAGYTSLGQLKNLPVSELKIDRSFVLGMVHDASDAHIVRSVIDLGHNLGLTIVAEGVETARALDELARYGCDVAQGYWFARPAPAWEFDLWRRDRRDSVAVGTARP